MVVFYSWFTFRFIASQSTIRVDSNMKTTFDLQESMGKPLVSQKEKKRCWDTENWFSLLTFSWIYPLIKLCRKRNSSVSPSTINSLYQLPRKDFTEESVRRINIARDKIQPSPESNPLLQKDPKINSFNYLFNFIKVEWLYIVVYKFIEITAKFLHIIILAKFLKLFDSSITFTNHEFSNHRDKR